MPSTPTQDLRTTMQKDLWKGRTEPTGKRYFEAVRPLPPFNARLLQHSHETQSLPSSVTLIGFSCDAGVKRNLGRTGAAEGPDAFRRQLAKLPFRLKVPFFDAGNILCFADQLEESQKELQNFIGTLMPQHPFAPKTFPVIIGGGHEVSWGHYLALAEQCRRSGKKLGIINFDAHFDLREPPGGMGNSGTAFYQIAKETEQNQEKFQYLCLGIQALGNHDELFQRAKNWGVTWIEGSKLQDQSSEPFVTSAIQNFMAQVDAIYLTICLDVFQQSVAPGVSAPQPLGIFPDTFLKYASMIIESGKVISMDLAELCPKHDGSINEEGERSMDTAKLAAAITATLLNMIPLALA